MDCTRAMSALISKVKLMKGITILKGTKTSGILKSGPKAKDHVFRVKEAIWIRGRITSTSPTDRNTRLGSGLRWEKGFLPRVV